MTWLWFPALGLGAGWAAGFLGIGGGVFLVPGFMELFRMLGYPPARVATAIGTSKAVVILAAAAALRVQARAGRLDRALLRRLAPAVVTGAVLGGALAAQAHPAALQGAFGAFLVLLGAGQWLPRPGSWHRSLAPSLLAAAAGMTAAVASVFGIGGGVLLVPLLTGPGRQPAHRAVGTAAGLMLFSAAPATAVYVALGIQAANPVPATLGFVHLPAWALAGGAALTAARWGARCAQGARPVTLRRGLGLALLVTGARVLWAR